MLLVPLGLEGRGIYRVPVVTLSLIAGNALAFLLTWTAGSASMGNVEVLHGLIEQSLRERPYVAVSERLVAALGAGERASLEDARAAWEAHGTAPPPEQRQRAQKDFDVLVDDYFLALDTLPWRRYGFVPSEPGWATLLTSMFMHAGWLHLLGNMLFLYVSGPYVEDVYGRVVFALGYLSSGVVATLGYRAASPLSSIPLVGASGAIAGVMGIVLVRLAMARIRFLFLPIVFLPNLRVQLSLPALVVLPLWLFQQLIYAARTPAGSGGVAWWAHIAGFAFGVVFAGVVMALRVEERWLGRSKNADEGQRALDDAIAARERGDFEKAHAALDRARGADPDGAAGWRESYELALAEDDTAAGVRALTRLLELLPSRGGAAAAMELVDDGRWAELRDVPVRLRFAVGSFLERQGQAQRALELYDEVIRLAPRDVLALRAMLRKGELQGKQGDVEAARRTLAQARSHPGFNEEWRLAVERSLSRLGAVR